MYLYVEQLICPYNICLSHSELFSKVVQLWATLQWPLVFKNYEFQRDWIAVFHGHMSVVATTTLLCKASMTHLHKSLFYTPMQLIYRKSVGHICCRASTVVCVMSSIPIIFSCGNIFVDYCIAPTTHNVGQSLNEKLCLDLMC